MLLEPKFLRYHNLLEDHFGYRQGDEPGAAYLEQWQELKRNIRHMNRFQKREKLRELNKMFEANKGKFEISHCSVCQTGTFQQSLCCKDFISNLKKANREIMMKYRTIQIGGHTVRSSQTKWPRILICSISYAQLCSFDRQVNFSKQLLYQ